VARKKLLNIVGLGELILAGKDFICITVFRDDQMRDRKKKKKKKKKNQKKSKSPKKKKAHTPQLG